MGNLCGKPSKENDPFSQPGRALGSAPPPQSHPRASVPKIGNQGQKLGGSSSGEVSDARRAAAKAAEVFTPRAHCWCPGEGSCWICADWDQIIGTSESKSAKGQARQGFGKREGTNEDGHIGGC